MSAAVLFGALDFRVERWPRPDAGPGLARLRVRRVGICGSDTHYYLHGRCGSFVPTRPFVLGHELTAEVADVGAGVEGLRAGLRVTVDPARACGRCRYCRSGRGNLCRRTVMLGSASTTPPTDGAFAEFVTVRADQCHVLPPEMDDGLGALMEPLAVALHAVKRAGGVSGCRLLVMGAGPIGLLVALTARAYGADMIVTSDPVAERRQTALARGADQALDPVAREAAGRVRELTGDGFDLIFEASGAAPALRQAFDWVRPGGTIVQIGTLPDEVSLPANRVQAREFQFIGSFRYGDVFDEAIRLVASGRVNLQPLISRVFPLAQAPEAMACAAGRQNVIKVQMDNSPGGMG